MPLLRACSDARLPPLQAQREQRGVYARLAHRHPSPAHSLFPPADAGLAAARLVAPASFAPPLARHGGWDAPGAYTGGGGYFAQRGAERSRGPVWAPAASDAPEEVPALVPPDAWSSPASSAAPRVHDMVQEEIGRYQASTMQQLQSLLELRQAL